MRKQEKSLFMTFLMTPDMANFSGHVHGGTILKLLDQVAYACAARYRYVVIDRPGDLQGADQGRRIGNLQGQCQLCRPDLDGDRDL